MSLAPRTLLTGAVVSAALGASVGHADPMPADGLSIRLVGLRSDRGRSGCALFGSAKGFPADSGAALQRIWCPISNSESICRFDPIPAGTYAVACSHDENGNGKCDTGFLGIPTEGTAASNNAKGFMGPPRFNDAKFAFAGRPIELRLKMNY